MSYTLKPTLVDFIENYKTRTNTIPHLEEGTNNKRISDITKLDIAAELKYLSDNNNTEGLTDLLATLINYYKLKTESKTKAIKRFKDYLIEVSQIADGLFKDFSRLKLFNEPILERRKGIIYNFTIKNLEIPIENPTEISLNLEEYARKLPPTSSTLN